MIRGASICSRPLVVTVLLCLLGQPGPGLGARQVNSPVADSGAPAFSDVTAAAGLRFRHNNGAFGKKYLPETLGSGCAFLDFDNDGWPDIFIVGGPIYPPRGAFASCLRASRAGSGGCSADPRSNSTIRRGTLQRAHYE